MNYSFEYIDIILLAMIAGFIFLRLRGILGKKTGLEEDIPSNFSNDFEFFFFIFNHLNLYILLQYNPYFLDYFLYFF